MNGWGFRSSNSALAIKDSFIDTKLYGDYVIIFYENEP